MKGYYSGHRTDYRIYVVRGYSIGENGEERIELGTKDTIRGGPLDMVRDFKFLRTTLEFLEEEKIEIIAQKKAVKRLLKEAEAMKKKTLETRVE